MKATVTVNFDAPMDKVWDGLTNPAIVKQYFFGTDLHTDWKKGSPITWTGEWEGKKYEEKGEVLDIDPGKFVKYTYWSSMSGKEDKPENYMEISYFLTGKNGGTQLEIVQDKVTDQQAKEHSEQNWISVFEGLKKILKAN